MQALTEPIVNDLSNAEDIAFVKETLRMTDRFLSGEKTDPDLLYSRMENLDEQGILPYYALDRLTDPTVWSCIIDTVAYICYLCYIENGEQYFPQTIESIDIRTIESLDESLTNEFLDRYKQYMRKTDALSDLKKSLADDDRVNLDNEIVRSKYDFLFSHD